MPVNFLWKIMFCPGKGMFWELFYTTIYFNDSMEHNSDKWIDKTCMFNVCALRAQSL